jgi:hypothetical protein
VTPAEELDVWVRVADDIDALLDGWDDVRPAEALVVDLWNPAPDLQRRAMQWNHEFATGELPELLRFGAGLALAEVQAWEQDRPDVATRALSDRRFLLGDRILHWAVPWLVAVGRDATGAREQLLGLGDLHRPEPELSGNEGLTPPGEDRFGPLTPAPLSSMLTGAVVLESVAASWGATRDSLRHGEVPEPAVAWLRAHGPTWDGLRSAHPGSAALWRDLAGRARTWGISPEG